MSEPTVDAGVAIYFKIFTEWMRLSRQNILSAQFTRSRPADTTSWVKHFGVTLNFSCEHSGLTLSGGALKLPISSGNPNLKSIGENALEKCKGSFQKPAIVSEVRKTLIKTLECGEAPSQELVARTLALSTRSLRRMLSNMDTTYSCIWNEVRRESAEHLLITTNLPISEVAWRGV
ncbi:MAG: AraC-like DNA-binding protein [Oceanicoccus sp.]|jgi:AraC-like DNA-binding protein